MTWIGHCSDFLFGNLVNTMLYIRHPFQYLFDFLFSCLSSLYFFNNPWSDVNIKQYLLRDLHFFGMVLIHKLELFLNFAYALCFLIPYFLVSRLHQQSFLFSITYLILNGTRELHMFSRNWVSCTVFCWIYSAMSIFMHHSIQIHCQDMPYILQICCYMVVFIRQICITWLNRGVTPIHMLDYFIQLLWLERQKKRKRNLNLHS